MKVQLDLFNEKFAMLDKAVLKERIKNTHLQPSNSSFTIKKWEPGDELLPMLYKIEDTPLGRLLIAATLKGITYLGFITEDSAITIADLKRRFPANDLTEGVNEWLTAAITHINFPEKELALQLHLKGTDFQLSVWQKLLRIPFGGLTNYKQLGNSNSNSRAVGAAVGANPVGYLVPCHRVIRADGSFDGFFWGNAIKAQLLAYEANCATN